MVSNDVLEYNAEQQTPLSLCVFLPGISK